MTSEPELPELVFEHVEDADVTFAPIIEHVEGRPGARAFKVLNQAAWDRLTPDEQATEKRRAHRRVQNRRRAEQLRANGPRERYTLQEIGDRDGWTCTICLTPVDRAFRAPHPCTPSIHHRVEVARRGPDTRDNVVLTHLFCNTNYSVCGERPPTKARAALADRVLYGKYGPGRRNRTPDLAAIALAAQIMTM